MNSSQVVTARRSPDPILKPDAGNKWEAYQVHSPAVLFDAERQHFRMWYAGATMQYHSRLGRTDLGYAESPTGDAWTRAYPTRPVLHAGTSLSLAGRSLRWVDDIDAHTPRIHGAEFDAWWAYGSAAVQADDQVHLWYTGWAGAFLQAGAIRRPTGAAIGYARSSDGRAWDKVRGDATGAAVIDPQGEATPTASVSFPSVVRWDDAWWMLYQADTGSTSEIRVARSIDGSTWQRLGPGLTGDPVHDEAAVGHPVLWVDRGRPWLFYQATLRSGATAIRAATSAGELTSWTRLGTDVLTTGVAGAWDDGAVYPSAVAGDGTRTCLFYTASGTTIPVKDGADLSGPGYFKGRAPAYRQLIGLAEIDVSA